MIASWKLAAAVGAASLALGVGVTGFGLSWKHRAEIAELDAVWRDRLSKGWEAAHKVNERVTGKFNEDLAVIAARPPPRTVLVCPTGRAVLPGASAGAGPEGGPGLPPAAGGEAGPDLGPFIASEADRADRCATQLNALIDWIDKVRKP